MIGLSRGDIVRIDLEPTRGSEQQGVARPCVVLSVGAYNNKLPTFGAVPLSSSPRERPPFIVSTPSAGLSTSMALCHQLRAVDKRRIVGDRRGALSAEALRKVEAAVRQYFGL